MIKKSFLIIFFLTFHNNILFANQNIVFVDIDKIIYTSNVGKKTLDELNKDFLKEEKNIIELGKNLKKNEEDILKKKNILSSDELNKEISLLRKKISDFEKNKNLMNEKFKRLRVERINILVQKLNQILANYADENDILLIIQKKNIVIGKSTLDITENILDIFNSKVKKID